MQTGLSWGSRALAQMGGCLVELALVVGDLGGVEHRDAARPIADLDLVVLDLAAILSRQAQVDASRWTTVRL